MECRFLCSKRGLDSNIEVLKLVFPEVLLDHFDLRGFKSDKKSVLVDIYFEERNIPPKEFSDVELISKGFYEEITIQDFPLRGKKVYLHVKRRHWTEKTTKQIVKRNWELVAQGTRLTDEFADFLKVLSQY